jgi:hypothetical protein
MMVRSWLTETGPHALHHRWPQPDGTILSLCDEFAGRRGSDFVIPVASGPGDGSGARERIASSRREIRCPSTGSGPASQSAEVLAALAELRAALPDAAARSETANETKTETRRPTEG